MKNTSRNEWNFIDRMLRWWRYKFVYHYLTKESVVCDIGCGRTPHLLYSIKNRMRIGYACDPKLDVRSVLCDDNIVCIGSVEEVPEMCDVVLLMAVIEHVVYPENAVSLIKSIYDKLNYGGYLIVTTPHKRSQKILEFLALKIKMINAEEILDHKHYYDKEELIVLMQQCGFVYVKHKYFQWGLNNLIICKK